MRTSREIAEARCLDWVRDANAASKAEDKAAMYELAAMAIERYDAEHANDLRRWSSRWNAVA